MFSNFPKIRLIFIPIFIGLMVTYLTGAYSNFVKIAGSVICLYFCFETLLKSGVIRLKKMPATNETAFDFIGILTTFLLIITLINRT